MSVDTLEKGLIRPESFQYIRIPGKCTTAHPHASLHKKAYSFWRSFWEQTLKENKVESIHIYADDFLRQDVISLVLYDKKIIGLVANTKWPKVMTLPSR